MATKTKHLLAPPILLHLVIFFFFFPQKGSAEIISMAKTDCPKTCGNISILYPFGIGEGCYLEERFKITCNVSSTPNYPLLLGNITVSQISLDYVFINQSIFKFCYNSTAAESVSYNSSVFPFRFAHTENKFVAMGSDIFAFMTQSPSKNYTTGCASLKGQTLCNSTYRDCSAPPTVQYDPLSSNQYLVQAYDGRTDSAVTASAGMTAKAQPYTGDTILREPFYGPNDPRNRKKGYDYDPDYRNYPAQPLPLIRQRSTICYGVYCCETNFPYDIASYNMQLNVIMNGADEKEVCGYAFIADSDFSVSYNITLSTRDISPHVTVVPAVLEWAVGNTTCEEAKKGDHYACRENSECFNSTTQGAGYKCRCRQGYEGNPYLPNGCQDVNECEMWTNLCPENAKCVNNPGAFSCTCLHGYHGVPTQSEGRIVCVRDKKLPLPLIISLGIGIAMGLVILLATAFWVYKRLEKRKKDILKRKFFDENGGRLWMALSKGSVGTMKLYIIEDLEKATDFFNVNRILGKGGFGTVYKGMLQDGSIVAVKKSNKVDEQSDIVDDKPDKADDIQVKQFVNEVFVLTQIDHKHIVKLLGCCLETKVPLLVYEHVSNGTLSRHLHDKRQLSTLSWENRLRIASEIANALHYLHSYGSAAIFHRDIKSNNILLDENLRAIVADFGISRPVSVKKTHLTASIMQGTHGYLDPEYFQTYQFTSKSDVYAFGVLLAELITGETAIILERNSLALASHFTSTMKKNDLFEIVDRTLVLNEDQKEEILVVATIAERCVELTGEKRPTMEDVAKELQKLRKKVQQEQKSVE